MTSRRQKASARRTAGFWAARLAQARGAEDRAAVAYDRLRSEIRAMPSGEQSQAWADLARRLDAIRVEVTGCEVSVGSKHRGDSAA